MQTCCSEHLHGICYWGLPCKHAHEFIQILASLPSEQDKERGLCYAFLWLGEKQLVLI